MRSFKVFLCLLLVLCLSALPFIQRVRAVVTVSTVVGVLILTVLAAMGITLVVKDMTKEAFVLDKGDSFMQSKGLSGSFAEWIAGGTDVDVALKTGFLVLAKPIVDRIKQFVSWLIPSAASDSVIDLGTGASITSDYMISGSVNSSGQLVPSVVGVLSSSYPISLSDGQASITISGTSYTYSGRYNALSGQFISGDGSSSAAFPFVALLVKDAYSYGGVTYLPGVYAGYYFSGTRTYFFSPREYYYIPSSLVDVEEVDASAIIGSYDDLSQLQDTTASDGTVNNTFYISSNGQALNPSSQDIADIIGALQQSLDDINRKLDVMPWTAAAAEAGTVVPDYTDFQLGDLDFTSLGALITTRFPFSIPWDMVRVFQLFVADPVAPKWEVDLLPIPAFDGVDTTVTLDLGQYPIVGQISRWFCIIDLCLGLVFASKKLIWTA